MQKKKVNLIVTMFPENTEEIYICGSSKNLGEWEVKNAVKLNRTEKFGATIFSKEFYFDLGDIIEYKYLSDKNWENVECGYVAEEIENRRITINSERFIGDEIKKWRK